MQSHQDLHSTAHCLELVKFKYLVYSEGEGDQLTQVHIQNLILKRSL